MDREQPPPMVRATEPIRLARFVERVVDYAICMLGPDGTVDSWNAGAERISGFPASAVLGTPFARFFPEEDRAAGLPERVLRVAALQGRFESEGWRLRQDGSRYWASVVVDPVRDDDGTLLGYAEIVRDITDRHNATEALRISEQQFALLVQSVTDYAIYMLSAEGIVSNWNAGAARIKGYAADEVVGTHFSRFYMPEDRAAGRPTHALQVAARTGRFESEGWRVRKDGSRFWAHVIIDAIREPSGLLVGFAKITRDTTERREAAAALERAREALLHAQRLDALGKLTGGVAHDFNNLLAVVLSGIELLRHRIKEPAVAHVVDGMHRAATRGAALTRQLLTFARQQPLQEALHGVNELINEFEIVLRRAVPETVTFSLNLQQRLPQVRVDATQFETALLNLIANARDAMPQGGRLSIETSGVTLGEREVPDLSAGEYVRVSVRDEGTGMAPDVVTRAIEPFFTTKPVGTGTGLGLSQAYGLATQLGGGLTIASEPGRGTTVALYLPVATHVDGPAPLPGPALERVLIVDDNPEMRMVTTELFKLMGYEVLAAASAAEALDLLRRSPRIHVLFTDIVMPGMSGVDLALEVEKTHPDTAILLTSGFPPTEARARMARFPYVPKPFRTADIVRALRRAH